MCEEYGCCALHCVEWQECDKKIYVCRLDVCDKGVCAVGGCVHAVTGLLLAGGCAVECEYDKELD